MLTYVVMTLPETFHPFLMETGQKHAEEWRFLAKRSQEEGGKISRRWRNTAVKPEIYG